MSTTFDQSSVTTTTVNTADLNATGTSVLGRAEIASHILPIYSTAVSYAAQLTDEIILVTATGQTITLPDATTCAGKYFFIKMTASGSVTVVDANSANIDGSASYSISAQYKLVEVVSDGTQWWIIGEK